MKGIRAMKFEVKNRFTGAVQFTAEIECDEATSRSIKLGLAVRWAVKTRANLADADLAGAYLAGANLAYADLAGADLAGAYLAGADLAGANLAHADLADADLAGADLAGANLAYANLAGALKVNPADIPIIPKIDAVILAAIEKGGTLDMTSWHGPNNHWCGTTHCRAGWAIHEAGEKGKALQDRFGAQIAGTLIYEASRPGQPAPCFFDPNDDAIADIRKCAAEQTAATS
jgi:hypothetical protein